MSDMNHVAKRRCAAAKSITVTVDLVYLMRDTGGN